jgi:hypothetical protein
VLGGAVEIHRAVTGEGLGCSRGGKDLNSTEPTSKGSSVRPAGISGTVTLNRATARLRVGVIDGMSEDGRMPQATPEQCQEVRHRREVFTKLTFLFVAACFLGAISLECWLGQEKSEPILFIGGFFLFVGFFIFALRYYRCPVCGQHFGRDGTGDGRVRCANCNTCFDA